MTTIIYGIAAMFEALFSILPAIGPLVNVLLIAIGSIATVIWVWYMINRQEEEKGFNH